MRTAFDFGEWWGCEIPGRQGGWFTVHARPYMNEQDAESWCEAIGGRNLYQGGYMLEPEQGQTHDECIAEAQAICDALNEAKGEKLQ